MFDAGKNGASPRRAVRCSRGRGPLTPSARDVEISSGPFLFSICSPPLKRSGFGGCAVYWRARRFPALDAGGEEVGADRARARSASVKAMFECVKTLFQAPALCPGLELLFWSLATKALVSAFSPVSSCSPDFATTSNCSGKVLEKAKFTVFLRLIAFELEACLLNSATHFKCFLPFI